jgi:hypothetical protein
MEKARQPCPRGHDLPAWTRLRNDCRPPITSWSNTTKTLAKDVRTAFAGYSGDVQADAKSVYDILFRDPTHKSLTTRAKAALSRVCCWSYLRRKYYEARLRQRRRRARALVWNYESSNSTLKLRKPSTRSVVRRLRASDRSCRGEAVTRTA